MEDIIEIYEPIYRESMNMLPFILVPALLIAFAGALLIIRIIKKRKPVLTPQELYQKALNDYLVLQKDIETISSHTFANRTADIFKGYLSTLYNRDYRSTTTDEMLTQIKEDTDYNSIQLEEFFKDKLRPAQYGKLELDSTLKNNIIKSCVDFINTIYTETGENIA